MATVRIDHVTHRYVEAPMPSVYDCTLYLHDSEFLRLYGESGSGKSTLLRTVAGLEDADEGAIYVGSRDVTRLPAQQRNIAMVFENYALYPHMTAAENIEFPLRVSRLSATEREDRVYLIAGLLNLETFLDQRPQELDGGQRQRVAIARALVQRPSVILFDEPFTNLPRSRRIDTIEGIRNATKHYGITAVYATNNRHELDDTTDRIAMMRRGRIDQVGYLDELKQAPRSEFVATAFGSPRPIAVTAERMPNGNVQFAGTRLGTQLPALHEMTHIRAVLPPDALHSALAHSAAHHGGTPIEATVLRHTHVNDERYFWCDVHTDHGLETVMARDDGATIGRQQCILTIDPVEVPVFDAQTGESLP